MARQNRAPYHHGDLREACISAGLELLNAGGKEAVSLREVARLCRVSPRAPYQHFDDKMGFLAVLAERGFTEFGAALSHAGAGLLGLAHAYLEFAKRRPALMQLMFGSEFSDRATRTPALDRAALATFAQLEQQIALVHPRLAPRSRRLLAANAWALVHGLSELTQHGQLAHVLRENEWSPLIEAAIDLVTRGQSAAQSAAGRTRLTASRATERASKLSARPSRRLSRS